MPRVAFFASSSSIRRDNAASSAVLSRPAIIGIALGGSFVLFLALSHLFIMLGRRRDRRRLAALQRQAAHAAVGSPVAALDLYESHVSSGGGARKSRLRKKSLLLFGAHSATASDADMNANNTNNNDQGWPVYEPATLLPPVLPPVFSRQQSYDLYPFLPGSAPAPPTTSNDGASTTRGRDDEFEREESQRLEKQRGRDMYQMRRRSSWIDEDALHGPRVSPKKSSGKKQKNNNEGAGGRRKSWLSGSLTRRLSLKKRRPLSDPVVFGSPTLPHVGPRESGRPTSLLALPYEMEATSPTRGNSQDSPLKPGQHNTVRIAIPSAVVSAPILPVPKPPSAMINNPRHRGGNSLNNNSTVAVGVLNDAAQLLAAREGNSSANTNNKILAPIPQRPSVPKHSATDSELSEILRMTTERLQDGKRSSRRQTMLIRSRTDGTETLTYEQHSTTANSNNSNMAVMNLTVNVGDGSSRTASPTKSQKSAPAAIACAELEANEVASPGKSCSSSSHHTSEQQQQQATPKRQHRHSRQMSQVSLASEADSLLTMRGTTYQPEHTTALSSPSRNKNVNNVNVKPMYEPAARREDAPQQQQQQKARPSSAASSHASSALSTLYSEDEEAAQQSSSLQTRMFPLGEAGERPYNPKRGTLGQMVPYPGGSSRPLPDPRGGAEDLHAGVDAWMPPETSLHFTIYPMDHDGNDDEEDDNDPFTAKAPSPDPVRLSQVFTPIPSSTFDFSSGGGGEDMDPGWSSIGDRGGEDPLYPTVRVTKPTTPTPSPKNNHSRRSTAAAAALVFPPPQNLRPVISSPTLGGRRQPRQPSPAVSEGGLSSVYESYAGSERANNYSTATLSTVPTDESAAHGGRPSVPRKMDAASYGATETRPHVDRKPSGDSVYSQDQDADPHNRPGLGLDLGLGLQQHDPCHFPRHADDADDDEDDVPPLTAPNSQCTSQLLAQTVAELRRMNSSVSAASGVSSVATAEGNNNNNGNGSASPTLPAMRGGGSSPGKRPAGTRNYLAVGGGGSPRCAARPISQGSSTSEAGIPARTGTRSRRGTMVGGSAAGLAGPAARGADGGRPMSGILREGSGGNLGGPEGGRTDKEKQLARLQARLAEAAGTSSESLGLYDDKGFLRSSPLARR
ncbi:hypothetical protein LQW54_005576 [Pestalotiopsis sp. IQ-011]